MNAMYCAAFLIFYIMKTDIQGQTVADGRARAETDRVDSTIRPTGGQCTHGANDCEFVLAAIERFLGNQLVKVFG